MRFGKRFRLGAADGAWVEVIGITPTTKYIWPGEGRIEFIYLPFRQSPSSRMTLMVHSAGDPTSLAEPLRQLARTIDSHQPVYDVRTMTDFYQDRVITAGVGAVNLVGWLGVMGMVLSMVGLYGLVSYSVNRRTREIGIRMAVGATPGSVMRIVLKQGFILTAVGAVGGLATSVGSRRALAEVFPLTQQVGYGEYVLLASALAGIAMLAAYIPARRASRVDPTIALRHE